MRSRFSIMITHRGTFDDGAKFHVSNGLYLEDVMKSISHALQDHQ